MMNTASIRYVYQEVLLAALPAALAVSTSAAAALRLKTAGADFVHGRTILVLKMNCFLRDMLTLLLDRLLGKIQSNVKD